MNYAAATLALSPHVPFWVSFDEEKMEEEFTASIVNTFVIDGRPI